MGQISQFQQNNVFMRSASDLPRQTLSCIELPGFQRPFEIETLFSEVFARFPQQNGLNNANHLKIKGTCV